MLCFDYNLLLFEKKIFDVSYELRIRIFETVSRMFLLKYTKFSMLFLYIYRNIKG